VSVERIYWDTDAFLGHLQGETGKVALCAGTLQRMERGEVVIITSALTIAEVLWRRNGPKIPKKKAEILRKFFKREGLRVRNVTRQVAEMAQDIVWNHNVMPKDAIHVATALAERVPILETFDRGLLGMDGRIGSPPLVIRKPIAPTQTTMDI